MFRRRSVERAVAPGREAASVTVVARVALDRARLLAELCHDGEVSFLHVRSRIDPAQSLLLPVRPVRLCAGLALATRIGRLHALYWGLAYGYDDGSHDARVRFEATGPFADAPVTVRPRCLADGYWVADAEGVFGSAVLNRGDAEIARVPLADRW